MPKMLCACGSEIHFGGIPCPDEWLFISDTEFDSFSGAVDAEEVYARMRHFLKCPSCSRLWIYWDGFENPPEEYISVRMN
jgi:hypothetical protein